MKESRYLLALLLIHEAEEKDIHWEDMLTEAKFRSGEIHYVTEVFEEKGLIRDAGFLGKVYKVTDEGEKVIQKASKLL